MIEKMTLHHFLTKKKVWQFWQDGPTDTLTHSCTDTMLTGKQLVARTEYSFIVSSLSLCTHHRVLMHAHNTRTQALFCTLFSCLHGNRNMQVTQ